MRRDLDCLDLILRPGFQGIRKCICNFVSVMLKLDAQCSHYTAIAFEAACRKNNIEIYKQASDSI